MEFPGCEERQRLFDRYRVDLLLYREAVAMLEKSLFTVGFAAACGHAERSRIAFETSREAFHRHTAEHGCSSLHAVEAMENA
jgi:hypothetical protein